VRDYALRDFCFGGVSAGVTRLSGCSARVPDAPHGLRALRANDGSSARAHTMPSAMDARNAKETAATSQFIRTLMVMFLSSVRRRPYANDGARGPCVPWRRPLWSGKREARLKVKTPLGDIKPIFAFFGTAAQKFLICTRLREPFCVGRPHALQFGNGLQSKAMHNRHIRCRTAMHKIALDRARSRPYRNAEPANRDTFNDCVFHRSLQRLRRQQG